MSEPSEHAPTIASPAPPPSGRASDARFLPGTVIAGRYRIVTPIGRGGMGDVYRADDLKLGQTVALKFLPHALERDPHRLTLLLEEVKLARQVSHPNVCRVWDAGESEGLHFLAMEYVDGEDLNAVLRRIGRLPEERAVQVAAEICAGLAAIHEQGVLHRDLKPANLMLDGRGRVRITDFGLATLVQVGDVADVRSGTPAYMAPEQLEGREVTVRSDVYALGLVLYELFTGRHAFASGRDLKTPISEARPSTPSSHVRALDPTIERAILRCLEPDPAARPQSASAVARALPGGDPLEAARLAGETPSPEMVAAAGGVGGMPRLAALGCVAFSLLGLVGVLMLAEKRGVPFGPDDKPFIALRDRATDFVRGLGYWNAGDAMVDGVSRVDQAGSHIDPRTGVFYWYRRSPYAILPAFDEHDATFDADLPAVTDPGALALRFDLRGRLLELRRVPASAEPPADSVDWRPLLGAAGFDPDSLAVMSPRIVAPLAVDQRRAWVARAGGRADTIEAAAFRGRPTFLVVGAPYVSLRMPPSGLFRATVGGGVFLLLFALSVIYARRNLRAGRADLPGATRLGLTTAWLSFLGWGLLAQPHIGLGSVLVSGVMTTMFFATFTGASYLALEPIVRRHSPEWLTSWTRLLGGRWLDPLVGRDVLIGTALGIAMVLIGSIRGTLAHSIPHGDFQAAAVGGPIALGVVLRGLTSGVLIALTYTFILIAILIAARREWLGWIVGGAIATLLSTVSVSGPVPIALSAAAIMVALWSIALKRSGLLGAVTAMVIFSILNEEYMTLHLGAWYAGVSRAGVAVVVMLLGWGWLVAVRGRRRVGAVMGV